MRLALQLSLPALALILLAQLGGCSCGFDCNNDSDGGNPAVLTLGLSDSLPEDLKNVVIEVDSITFKRSGSPDVLVNTFTVGNQTNEETVQVDLLQYPGKLQAVVVNNLEMATGSYDSVEIKILVGSVSNSYVVQSDDTQHELTVANSGVLTLPGIDLSSGTQTFVVEFGLAQALTQSTNGSYLLANTGIRIEDTATDASLSGQVDSALFTGAEPCADKQTPTAGNRIYLYQKTTATRNVPADVYTTASTRQIPATAQAPFAVASLLQNDNTDQWEYTFGYLPPGDYVLAFACNTQTDTAVNYEGLVIPQPTNQRYEISLSESEAEICNLTTTAKC